MSKRCCASMCFNSQTNNKKVSYFGFPKHEEYARAWAKLASRDDLLDKSLNNVIKYFLCSEHFTDDCFHDPPNRTKLKKTIRPVTVPMPSIFRCNIDQYIRYDPIAVVNQHTSDLFDEITHDTERSQPKWTKMYDVETHTNQLLIEYDLTTTNQQKCLLQPAVTQYEISSPVTSSSTDNEFTVLPSAGIDDNCMYLNKTESFDYIEPYCLIDVISPNEIAFEVDEPSDKAKSDVNASLMQCIQKGQNSTVANEKMSGTYDATCRLCAKTFETDIGLIQIFAEDNKRLKDSINSVLPDTIMPSDGLPQSVCFTCYTKVMGCAKAINSFKLAQDKF